MPTEWPKDYGGVPVPTTMAELIGLFHKLWAKQPSMSGLNGYRKDEWKAMQAGLEKAALDMARLDEIDGIATPKPPEPPEQLAGDEQAEVDATLIAEELHDEFATFPGNFEEWVPVGVIPEENRTYVAGCLEFLGRRETEETQQVRRRLWDDDIPYMIGRPLPTNRQVVVDTKTWLVLAERDLVKEAEEAHVVAEKLGMFGKHDWDKSSVGTVSAMNLSDGQITMAKLAQQMEELGGSVNDLLVKPFMQLSDTMAHTTETMLAGLGLPGPMVGVSSKGPSDYKMPSEIVDTLPPIEVKKLKAKWSAGLDTDAKFASMGMQLANDIETEIVEKLVGQVAAEVEAKQLAKLAKTGKIPSHPLGQKVWIAMVLAQGDVQGPEAVRSVVAVARGLDAFYQDVLMLVNALADDGWVEAGKGGVWARLYRPPGFDAPEDTQWPKRQYGTQLRIGSGMHLGVSWAEHDAEKAKPASDGAFGSFKKIGTGDGYL